KTLASPVITTQLDLSNEASLRLFEATGNGTHKVTLKAPSALTADYTLTLPADDGANNQVLKTDGSGNLAWVDQSGGSAKPYVVARLLSSTTQSINNSTTTTVALATEDHDSGGLY